MKSKPALIPTFVLAYLFFIGFTVGFAQDKVKLTDVKITGNIRVEEEGIRLHVKSRTGDSYDPALVDQDVKAIFRMGFFDDVQAELSPEGVLTYSVKEKPYVREVRIQGNAQVSRDKIETALGCAQRPILDRSKVAEGGERLKNLYVGRVFIFVPRHLG